MSAFSSSISTEKRMEELQLVKSNLIDQIARYNPPKIVDSEGGTPRTTQAEDRSQLVHMEEGLRPSSFPFPVEIVIECFRHAIDADPNFVYTMVLLNRNWEELTISTASFWNTIVLDNMDEQYPWKLYAALQFSRDLPLTVVLRFSSLYFDFNLDSLIQEKSRINTLMIHATHKTSRLILGEPNVGSLSVALWDLGELINLMTLINETPESSVFVGNLGDPFPRELITLYPRLRQLVGWKVTSNEITALNFTSLESLSVTEPVEVFIRDYLSRMPAVKHLHFVSEDPAEEIPRVPRSELLKNIYNLALESLQCPTEGYSGDNPLLSVPTLRFLSVEFTWRELGNFLHSVETLPCLETFKLTISGPGDSETFAAPESLPKLSRLQNFNLTISPWSNEESATNFLEVFSAMWAELMPYITSLSFLSRGWSLPDSFFSHLQQLQRLKILKMQFDPHYLKSSSTFTVSKATLNTLTSINTNLLDLLQVIEAPSLISAHIDIGFIEKIKITLPLTLKITSHLSTMTLSIYLGNLFKNNDYSNLKEINWISDPGSTFYASSYTPIPAILPFTLTLHALENLTFASSNISIEEQHNVLLAMLEQPISLPRLKRLSFSEFPSFSLLLRVLFQRNVVIPVVKEVDNIKEIILPGLPAQNIMLRLAYALAGKIPPAEALEEPFPEQDVALYDPDIPGCIRCFDGGHSCSVPFNTLGSPGGGGNTESNAQEDITSKAWVIGTEASWCLSDTTWNNLWQNMWDERNARLKHMENQEYVRRWACGKWSLPYLKECVSITGTLCAEDYTPTK